MIIRYIIQNIFKCSNIMPFEFYTKRAGVRRSSPASNWCRRTDNKGVFFLKQTNLADSHAWNNRRLTLQILIRFPDTLGSQDVWGTVWQRSSDDCLQSLWISHAFHCFPLLATSRIIFRTHCSDGCGAAFLRRDQSRRLSFPLLLLILLFSSHLLLSSFQNHSCQQSTTSLQR